MMVTCPILDAHSVIGHSHGGSPVSLKQYVCPIISFPTPSHASPSDFLVKILTNSFLSFFSQLFPVSLRGSFSLFAPLVSHLSADTCSRKEAGSQSLHLHAITIVNMLLAFSLFLLPILAFSATRLLFHLVNPSNCDHLSVCLSLSSRRNL